MDDSKRRLVMRKSILLSILCLFIVLFISIMNLEHDALVHQNGSLLSWSAHPPLAINYKDLHHAEGALEIESPLSDPVSTPVASSVQPKSKPPQAGGNESSSSEAARGTVRTTPDVLQCAPRRRIVFLKTHKTASTTVASIFERYGYYRNLTFAVGRSHILSFKYKFSRRNVMQFPGMKGRPFDILTNHARYNRPEMDAVVPDAVYITILRAAEDQVESSFGYFEMYRGMGIGNESNPLKAFMADPMKYYADHRYNMWQVSRNGMLFDFGFDHKYDEDDVKILEKVLEVAWSFDLVMLLEFIDESLVVMKKLLCWEFEDILYISSGVRSTSHRYENDADLTQRLRDWSHGDALLYDHFNKTLWKKVADYGPSFQEDLRRFRDLNKATFDECINVGKMDKHDRRIEAFTLLSNSERCKGILRGDMPYTQMIRKSMIQRFGSPQ